MKSWAFALTLAAAAAALQWSVRPWVGEKIPFLFFMPAVVMAAALAGRGAGMFVTAAGLLSALRWLGRDERWWIESAADGLSLAIFVAFGLMLSALGARLRLSSVRASDAEQRLLIAGEDTGIGIFDLDLAAQTIYLTPALAAMCGVDVSHGPVPVDELLARLRPEIALEGQAIVADAITGRARAVEREVRLPSGDGGVRWLMLRVHVAWVGERAVRLRGACIDITERKTVDELLDRTKAELSQQVTDLHRLHELSSRLLEPAALPEQLRMILSALSEFHGARLGLVSLFDARSGTLTIDASIGFPPAALARLLQTSGVDGACARVCATRERAIVDDVELAQADAGLRSLAREQGFRAVHSTPLVGPHGEVLGAISIHLDAPRTPTERERTLADICARKAAIFVERARAQAAFEESQGRFQAVLDASAVPFVVLTPAVEQSSGQIVDFEWSYVNGAAANALRLAPEAFLGKRVQDLLPARWAGSASFEHYIAVVEQGVTREFETRVDDEGAERWFHCVASAMNGSVALWFTDVTARKRDEQMLQEADRRKDEFLATLAHELRNPLAPIRQAASISRLPHASEAQKRWSHDVIDRQVRHMALLLDDLLDVSRITRGVLALRRGPNALGDMLEAAVETARPLIEARRHELEIVVPPAAIVMQADPLRVSQIVANLLTNAAKYTDPGGHIRLAAALDGDDVTIDVGDDGIGIAAESLPAVFDMFTQLRGADERAGGGLGIGLALTKGLVELHGGGIAVRSGGVGRGSVFSVRLPRGENIARAIVEPPQAPRAPTSRRILVADDNRDAAESLAALLELEGHDVTLAFDGEQALRAYERVRPDVCLLDIGMPRHTGNEVAARIRAAAHGASGPTLVAITGWGQEHDRSQALAAGFDHHLTKPVDPAQLLRLIGEASPGQREPQTA
ncbi:MAG: ATP-binding protein [Burkholderiaceae bacterium]